jgi:isopentenyl phosphate kinase
VYASLYSLNRRTLQCQKAKVAGKNGLLDQRNGEELSLKSNGKASLTILKLGGSVITKKDEPMTPDLEAIQRLAKEIARAQVDRLILVHGGGSFGHPLAKQYNIKQGYVEPSQLEGFSRTHQAMLKLNKLVVDALICNNIAAFSVSPSSCILTKDGRIELFFSKMLALLLGIGCIPVLFGDVVLDIKEGFTIVSGDQLTSVIAKRFKANRVILGVDVDGLYTGDPKEEASAQLMSHVTQQNLETLIHNIGEAQVTDVTGGMLGKISELMQAIEAGIPALVVNGSKDGYIYRALKGEMVGTLIEKGSNNAESD